MKKILFALCLLLIVVVSGAYAQKIHYGLKGGLNFSNPSTNFYGGGFATIKLHNKWFLQPEAMYYRSGSVGAVIYTTDGMFQQNVKEDYISIPLMIQYHITPKLYVEAGPEISFLVSANEEFNGNKYSVTEKYRRVGLGMSVGIGYKLPYGLGVHARYTGGVTSFGKEMYLSNTNAKVGLDYTFKIK